jgi:hypothetical protein
MCTYKEPPPGPAIDLDTMLTVGDFEPIVPFTPAQPPDFPICEHIVGVIEACKREEVSLRQCLGEVFFALQHINLLPDGFFDDIDFFSFFVYGIQSPHTAEVQLTLKCLLIIFKIVPAFALSCCYREPHLFVRLLKSPDLCLPSLTPLLLAIENDCEFSVHLVEEHHFIAILSDLACQVQDSLVLAVVLTTLSEVIAPIRFRDIDPDDLNDIIKQLRSVTFRFFGGDLDTLHHKPSFAIPDVLIPTLKILDRLIVSWEHQDLNPLLEFTLPTHLLFFTKYQTGLVYVELLKVWNRVYEYFGETFQHEPIAGELLKLLMAHVTDPNAPRLEILFLLSNMLLFPRHARSFLETPRLSLFLEEALETLDFREKENLLLAFLHVVRLCPGRPCRESRGARYCSGTRSRE